MSDKEKLADLEKRIKEIEEAIKNATGTPTEVYARIVGYYRAVRNWNKGKAEEFTERKTFSNPVDTGDFGKAGDKEIDKKDDCEDCKIDTKKDADKDSENDDEQKNLAVAISRVLRDYEGRCENNNSHNCDHCFNHCKDYKSDETLQKMRAFVNGKLLDAMIDFYNENKKAMETQVKKELDKINGKYNYNDDGGDDENNEQLQETGEECATDTADAPAGFNCDGRAAWNEYKEVAKGFRAEVYTKDGCPNCPAVLKFLEDVPFACEYIDVATSKGLKKAGSNGVFSSPTVIFYNGKEELNRCHSVKDLEEMFKGVRNE